MTQQSCNTIPSYIVSVLFPDSLGTALHLAATKLKQLTTDPVVLIMFSCSLWLKPVWSEARLCLWGKREPAVRNWGGGLTAQWSILLNCMQCILFKVATDFTIFSCSLFHTTCSLWTFYNRVLHRVTVVIVFRFSSPTRRLWALGNHEKLSRNFW